MARQFHETLFQGYGQFFDIDRVVFETRTEHQHLIIFENRAFGTVMALDGIVQTTQRDEFVYHEMLVHTPILAHGDVKRVLIIGGGDGGSLRETLKHPAIEQVIQVEIDASVIEMCKTYLPGHSAGAFDDPRAKVEIGDGFAYVMESDQKFDVVVCDSTDPVGPGEVLYSEAFYTGCRRVLNDNGIFVGHAGVAWFQTAEAIEVRDRLAQSFQSVHFYSASVPTYVGGVMIFPFASNSDQAADINLATLQSRFDASGIPTRYYSPLVHKGAFGLPRYFVDAVEKGTPPPGPQWQAADHEALRRGAS
ncbi:MAG: polyamine aminopropyltransferase [Gammaproteobacteria bacterium]|nr:polyamine aminopropyltransferase [Gammaproteobacteria bacterium]